MKEGNNYMKNFTIKINGKEIFIDDIQQAIDLVEATYGSCVVVFADNRIDAEPVQIEWIQDLQELKEEYKDEL